MSPSTPTAERRPSIEEVLADTRPLTARSVAATALLGSPDGHLPAAALVHAGSLFGIGGGAIRTALWRMVASGELTADNKWYALAGPLLDRRARVDESARHPGRRPWDGSWELAIVTIERRPAHERQELRHAATGLHLSEIREGVWARPNNLDPDRHPQLQSVIDGQCARFRGASAPSGFERQLFELDSWVAGADVLHDAMRTTTSPAGDASSQQLRQGFLLSVAVVRHLQADPLLPDELLPPDWNGNQLRQAYTNFDQHYQDRLTTALEQQAADTEPA